MNTVVMNTANVPYYNTIFLRDVNLQPDIHWVLKHFGDLAKQGKMPKSNTRRTDYARWSIALEAIRGSRDLLDIGIGAGQFPNAAMHSGWFDRVRGVDRKPHTALKTLTDFEFVGYDLTTEPPEELRSEVVTCMECIEHIPSPEFDAAIVNLKYLTKRQLIVTVPFLEEEPLPSYHYQRFTVERLQELFPGADLTFMTLDDGRLCWAMVDWQP